MRHGRHIILVERRLVRVRVRIILIVPQRRLIRPVTDINLVQLIGELPVVCVVRDVALDLVVEEFLEGPEVVHLGELIQLGERLGGHILVGGL